MTDSIEQAAQRIQQSKRVPYIVKHDAGLILDHAQQIAAKLETIIAGHYCYDHCGRWACGGCEQDHPCDSFANAVTALALLRGPQDDA